jgi:hypothetical protein
MEYLYILFSFINNFVFFIISIIVYNMPRTKKAIDDNLAKALREYKPDITESSLRTYILNLSHIASYYDKPLSPELFKDIEEVKKDFEELKYSNSTLKNKVASILIYLRMTKQSADIIKKYNDWFDMLSGKISREHAKMDKTIKEEDNWMSKQNLMDYTDKLKLELPSKPTSKVDMSKWMKYITLLIHTYYPFRNELADTEILTSIKKNNPDVNYFIVDQRKKTVKALIQAYKTKKTYKDININIIPDVAKEIITYYKHLTNYKKANDINNDWMLLAKNNDKMSRNDFTYFVKSIFEPLGKNISTTMIRKIIVSDLYPVEEMKQLAQVMGHSTGVAMEFYAKD